MPSFVTQQQQQQEKQQKQHEIVSTSSAAAVATQQGTHTHIHRVNDQNGKKQICAKNYNERVALARTTSVQGAMLRLLRAPAGNTPGLLPHVDISRLLSQRQRLRQRRHRNRLAVSLPPVICCNLSDLELQFIVACWEA